MPQKQQRKNAPRRIENYLRLRGYLLAGTVIIAGFSLLAWKLYDIQIVHGDEYRQLASEQQLMDSTIKAVRGSVYDATGKTLAVTSIMWDIACDPMDSKGLSKTETVDGVETKVVNPVVCAEVSDGVTRILLSGDGERGTEIDAASPEYQAQYQYIYDRLSQVNRQYRLLASKVVKPVSDAISKYISEYNEADGIEISFQKSENYKRSYPYGAFAAAVLGFCDADGYGAYGLERAFQSTLAGTDGRSVTIKNAHGNEIENSNASVYEAQDGNSLNLSLDTNVQQVIERYLNEAVAANSVENRGCAIVMNVKTGEILGMASKPDFDPNEPYSILDPAYMAELVAAEPELYAHYLTDDTGAFVLDALGNKVVDTEYDYTGTYRDVQWKNKAITELYFPGSVFKVLTAAMGVDSGVATIDTSFGCNGEYIVADRRYHCANRKAHGVQNLALGLRNSCNIYFIQLGQRMGASLFYDYFNAFGFNETTGVDLPYETRYKLNYTASQLGEVELASSAFGQAMSLTPLQVCTSLAACVNGGYLVTPHVVSSISDASGNVVEEIGTTVKRQVISESASAVIREIMEYEIGDGTEAVGGYNAYVAGYRIGGKSGTSEQLNMEKRESDGDYKKVASFAAVLPADDPEILVYVMLDDPNNASTDYSSVLAAPVVGNIISEIAPYLGLATNGVDLTQTTVKVPNLVGKEWSNAQVSLNRTGLKHRLVESAAVSSVAAPVTYQFPAAGTLVAGGTTVYLYIDGSAGSTVSVPSVVGKSAAFAQQMLSAAGLNSIVTGDADGTVTAQSVEMGEIVQMGTVVTVDCAQAVSQGDASDTPAA